MTRAAEDVPLGSVTTWLSGGTPDRANDAYWKGSIPWISATSLKGTHIYDSNQHITPQAVRAGSKIAPRGATLLLVRGMALHREVRAGLARRPVSFNQDVKALIPARSILPAYLTYVLLAKRAEILKLVSSAGSGTGVLDTNLLKRISIWLPDLEEQEVIVEKAKELDVTITTLERLIFKKHAVKLGMVQELVSGRTRLPGFAKPWEETELGTVIGTLRAGVSVGSAMNVGQYSILKTSCVQAGKFDPNERKSVRQGDAHRLRLNPLRDSLIISRMNTPDLVGEVGYVSRDYPKVFLPDKLWLATTPSGNVTNMRWLAYLLSSPEYSGRIKGQATGTTGGMKNITRETFLRTPLARPPKDEQAAITEVLADIDSCVDRLERRLTKLKAIRQGMLQQLVAGRIRLVPEERPS